MLGNGASSGVCKYEDFELEYQIVSLDYSFNKILSIEAICYNPSPSYHKEATFKYSTTNLNSNDERLKIANLIINTIVGHLGTERNKLRRLSIRNGEVFYMCSI